MTTPLPLYRLACVIIRNDPRNAERLVQWWQRWHAATGTWPDVIQHALRVSAP